MMDHESLTKNAIDYLLARERRFEVSLLLRAETLVEQSRDPYREGDYSVVLRVPADRLDFYRNALTADRDEAISSAYKEVLLSYGWGVGRVSVWATLATTEPYPGWQQVVESRVRGDSEPLNQAMGAPFPAPLIWNGLRFRSRTEVVMAKAFSRAKVLFFPLPAAVYQERKMEPDFLVCVQGKWGILEVHGEPYHPPETAARESQRRRWLLRQGVPVVEFYDSTRCYNDPDNVVREFLSILGRG